MQNSGLIKLNDSLELTDTGLCLAKCISRRHRITERFLSEVLNLPWDKVYEETSRWENVLSPVTEKAMLKLLGYPNTCLLYTSPSPRDATLSRMPSSA